MFQGEENLVDRKGAVAFKKIWFSSFIIAVKNFVYVFSRSIDHRSRILKKVFKLQVH